MPCKIEIKQNLTNKVSADTDSGFNLSIEGAQAVAKKVNQSYGIRVVSFSLNGDFIDRDIRIPDSLVDIYYNHELSLEQQEPVKAPVVIKPGVEELFNSTPELANAVYEALGVEVKNFKLIPNNEKHPEDANTYDVIYNNEKIGVVALFEGKNKIIKGVKLDEKFRNKGLGKKLYKFLN